MKEITTLDVDNKIDIRNMISNHGFFYLPIKNIEMVNKMMNTTKEYFNLPLKKKLLQPHNKDGLGYIPHNRVRRGVTITKESYTYIPNKISSPFENIFSDYYKNMNMIAREIFCDVMNTLNISHDKYNEIINLGSGTLSILHYPESKSNGNTLSLSNKNSCNTLSHSDKDSGNTLSLSDKDSCNTVGISPHTDWGLLTILYTDMDGLQVNINGKWVNIPCKKDHFIINIADMIEILTNGKYKSTIHRVINKNEKYSLAFFYEPHKDCIIKPLDNNFSQYNPVKYSMYHGNKINVSTNNLI